MDSAAIVVPTRSRPGHLRRCLAAFLKDGRCSVPIFVVDQDSLRSAEAVCGEFPDANIQYVHHASGGKSAALNAGIAASTSAVLAFTDDDCAVPEGWLTDGVSRLLADSRRAIVFGGMGACLHDSRLEFVPSYLPARREVRRGWLAPARIGAMGSNMFVRRSILEEVGGFDEQLGPWPALPQRRRPRPEQPRSSRKSCRTLRPIARRHALGCAAL